MHTKIDKVQRKLVGLFFEVLRSSSIDREAGKAPCKVTVDKL
jgi:hypothetical protein